MPFQVCLEAALQCGFCATPSNLVVLPVNRVLTENKPAANIMDYVPVVNIMPFGACMSPTNPAVVAATEAAWGDIHSNAGYVCGRGAVDSRFTHCSHCQYARFEQYFHLHVRFGRGHHDCIRGAIDRPKSMSAWNGLFEFLKPLNGG